MENTVFLRGGYEGSVYKVNILRPVKFPISMIIICTIVVLAVIRKSRLREKGFADPKSRCTSPST